MKILILVLFCLYEVQAKPISPKELALLAEERAPLIRMQVENNLAAQSQVSQTRTLANPVVTLQSGSLKSATQAGSVVDLTLSQPIPWFGRRQAATASAEILKRVSEVDLEESKLMINHSVSLLCLEIASLVELEKHHSDRKKRFGLIHRALNSRPLASPKQVIDKDLIETQIKLVEILMNQLSARKMSLMSELEILTGETGSEIQIDWRNIPKPVDKSVYLSMIENSPKLRRSEGLKQYALNRVEEARLQARPDILVGVNYRQENIAPVNHFYHAQVSLVIPIIDRGQHSMEVARAQARREEASKKLISIETMTLINQSYQTLLSAYQSSHIFKISELKKIENRFIEAEDSFRKGRIDAMTFLQTDTQIHESIDLAFNSYVNYYSSLAQINLLVGQKLDL
jgi:outer membrane protein TolC